MSQEDVLNLSTLSTDKINTRNPLHQKETSLKIYFLRQNAKVAIMWPAPKSRNLRIIDKNRALLGYYTATSGNFY